MTTSTMTVSSSPSANCSIVKDPGISTARFDSYCARKVNVLGLSGNLNVSLMEYLCSSPGAPGGWRNASDGQVAQCPMCRPIWEGWSCSILSCRNRRVSKDGEARCRERTNQVDIQWWPMVVTIPTLVASAHKEPSKEETTAQQDQ